MELELGHSLEGLGRPAPGRPALLWLPLRFLAASDIARVASASRTLRAAARSNELWYRLTAARWRIRPRRFWFEDASESWLRQYHEWHSSGRLPTGLFSGVSDTVLAQDIKSTLCVWLCVPRGDTRLPHGTLRPPVLEGPIVVASGFHDAIDRADFGVSTRPPTRASVASASSTVSRESRGSAASAAGTGFTGVPASAASGLVAESSGRAPATADSQFLQLKLVVQNVSCAADLVVAASDIALEMRTSFSEALTSSSRRDDSDPTAPGGHPLPIAVIPAAVPAGHSAVVAVSGVAPDCDADVVAVRPGGFAVLRVAFSIPARATGSGGAGTLLSEPGVLEQAVAVTVRLRLHRVPVPVEGGGGVSVPVPELPLRFALRDTWRHYRAAGGGLFVRAEP